MNARHPLAWRKHGRTPFLEWVCHNSSGKESALVRIVFRLERRVKMQVRKMRRQTCDKGLAMRCQVVLLADRQRRRAGIAESVGCSVSWVQRVLRRFREVGVGAL